VFLQLRAHLMQSLVCGGRISLVFHRLTS
jgi:hypothetical protein